VKKPMILALLAAVSTLHFTPAMAVDKVTLRLDWSTIGYHSPFYLAAERGYYKDAGLDVDIQEGKGSGNTVQLIGNGADTFGYADAAVAAKSASQGVPVKVVMGIIRKSPASIAYPLDQKAGRPQGQDDHQLSRPRRTGLPTGLSEGRRHADD